MKNASALTVNAARLLSGVAISAMMFASANADEIVVTSQRKQESIQDVPLSVTAVSAADLEKQQIESFTDFQTTTPNFSFSRTQFTSASIVIRGIGALAVAADSEPALSVHMNDLPLSSPRLFETEFFDMERIEILRGPQGTLFGRNATGGVINVITAKADPDDMSASAEVQYGNYDHVQVKGHVNIPLGDTAAFRVAGLKMNRDGYSTNLYDGQDVDDRDIGAVRGSLRWYPTENTTVDLVASFFNEEDNRMRSTKTLCTRDPSGVRGCLPGSLGFDTPNIASTLNVLASSETYILASGGNPAAGAFGLFSVADQLDLTGPANPADYRTINTPFTPTNDAEELILMGNIQHDFENFSVKLTGGWGRSSIDQQQQQNNLSGPDVSIPLAVQFGLPIDYAYAFSDGMIPISAFETEGFAGSIGGNTQGRTNTLAGIDYSTGYSEYYSIEGIVTSNLEGPFNFLVGGNYNHSEGYANFHVAGPALDYTSIVGAGIFTMTDGVAFYGPNFYNDGNVERKSISAFAEVYVDLSEQLKLTGGIRYNNDTKNVRDRGLQPFGSLVCVLSNPTCPINPLNPLSVPPFAVPLGTDDVSDFLDPDPFTAGSLGVSDFRVDSNKFEAVTGRGVLEWIPNDGLLIYASYSRGYKPGGFNPLTAIGGGVAPTYESEFINAFEVGAKITGDTYTLNLAGFYYDYSGLQVSRIVSRTAINDNIDATIWGLEGELQWEPIDRFSFNATASYLNTSIGDFSAFDPADPAAGDPNAELFKDLTTAANCVVTRDAADPALIGQVVPGPITITPFFVCSELENIAALFNGLSGTNYEVVPGIEQDLSGNELPGAPNWQFNVGAQYAIPVGASHDATIRVDYYRQGDFYARPFNTANDLIEGFGQFNAQLTLAPTDGPWYVRGFVQNAFNDQNITGAYLQDASSGLNTNVFLQEPRRYGIAIGARF